MKYFKIIALLSIVFLFSMCKKDDDSYVASDYHFNKDMITSDIPGDVNPEVYKSLSPTTSLDTANWANLAKLKRVFNIYSWQSLLAINWPLDKDGKPLPNFTDKGQETWLGWKEAFEVYRCDGEEPTPWGSKRIAPEDCSASSSLLDLINPSELNDRTLRVLHLTNKHKNIIDETGQAFTGPLRDRNGNIVFYEVLMNKEEYDYVKDNGLYSLDGQIAFSTKKSGDTIPANFPSGIYGNKQKGAIEIKLSWRVLEPTKGDDASRYITMKAMVPTVDEKSFVKKTVGLVGMHISQKPTSSKQWVWSTFEHVDNLNTASLEAAVDNKKRIEPSFYDYYNPTLVTDSLQYKKNDSVIDKNVLFTQVERRIPFPPDVIEINNEVKAILKKMGSKWQYYDLVDTQFPTDPSAIPTVYDPSKNNTVESINNKPGGNPTPTYLTNITMETYFQIGNQYAYPMQETKLKDKTRVFGTESCMGCHSSAGICVRDSLGTPIFANQLTGDFSWLLSKKAHFKKKTTTAKK